MRREKSELHRHRLVTCAAGAAYVLITALLFHELLPYVTTDLYSDLGDPLLNASILDWSARHLPMSEAWWNFPSFAPLSGVTAFTEHLLAAYPVSAPIIWLTGNPVLAHNVVLLLAFPLNGLAAYFLAREVTRSSSAALVGGLAFAFAPYVSVHLSHVQTLMAFGMPLGILGLHRYLGGGDRGSGIGDREALFESRSVPDSRSADPGSPIPGPPDPSDPRSPIPDPRSLLLFACGWLFTAFSNAYMLVFFPVFVALWCAWFVRPGEWRRLGAVVLTAVVATLPVIPLLWGYRVRQAAYGFERGITEIKAFSADMVGLAGISHREWLWRGILPHTYAESALFPGLTILGLAIIAVAMSRHAPASASPFGPAKAGPHKEEGLRAQAPGPSSAPSPSPGPWALSPVNVGAGFSRPRASAALFLIAGILTVIVAARAWTGPFGWHLGPIPLPPFAPFRVATIAALAFLIGLVATTRFRHAWAVREPLMFYAAAAVIMWLLALGPQPEWSGSWRALTYGPYWLFLQLPSASSIRVPARAWLPGVLCLAVLAAAGVAALQRRFAAGRRPPATYRALLAAIAVAIVAECWFVDGHVPAPAPMPPGVIPAGAMVLDLPFDDGFWNAIPQYRALRSGYRAINGYSGYEPPHVQPLRRAIADLEVDALNSFRVLADLYVIVRPDTPAKIAHWIAVHPGAHRIHADRDAQVFRLSRLNPDAPRRQLPLPLPGPQQRRFGMSR